MTETKLLPCGDVDWAETLSRLLKKYGHLGSYELLLRLEQAESRAPSPTATEIMEAVKAWVIAAVNRDGLYYDGMPPDDPQHAEACQHEANTQAHFTALLSRLRTFEDGVEAVWRPIETFDGRSEAVLVWCPDRQNRYVAYRRGDLWFNFGGYNRHPLEERITHWHELPKVPDAIRALKES